MTSKEALEKIISDYKFKEKVESGYVYHTEVPFMKAIVNIMEDLEILKQYKNIEKELGIDLITLFKALKNGIWVKEDNTIKHLCTKLGYQVCGSLSLGGIAFEDTYYNEYYYEYEDYGKTWALTREELKNE